MKPRFLIGYSVCNLTLEAFEAAGCEAWTCDILPSRGRADRHLQCDIWEVANDRWNGALFHPMCTYLTVSAAWAFADPDFQRYSSIGYHQRVAAGTLVGANRRDARDEAIENFKRLLALPYPKAVENPAPSFISNAIRAPDQTVHPYHFGDDASKRTGLWLDRLPLLKPTAFARSRAINGQIDLLGDPIVMRWANQTDAGQNRLSPSDNRWLQRSATFPGLAKAMGSQWGSYLVERLAA